MAPGHYIFILFMTSYLTANFRADRYLYNYNFSAPKNLTGPDDYTIIIIIMPPTKQKSEGFSTLHTFTLNH